MEVIAPHIHDVSMLKDHTLFSSSSSVTPQRIGIGTFPCRRQQRPSLFATFADSFTPNNTQSKGITWYNIRAIYRCLGFHNDGLLPKRIHVAAKNSVYDVSSRILLLQISFVFMATMCKNLHFLAVVTQLPRRSVTCN